MYLGHVVYDTTAKAEGKRIASSAPEVLPLKHESRILGQWSYPVCGSRKSNTSSPWAKQHRVQPITSWRNHIQGWMNVNESYSLALEQGTLQYRGRGSSRTEQKAITASCHVYARFAHMGRRRRRVGGFVVVHHISE